MFLILAGIVDPTQKNRPSVDVFRQVNSLENYNPKEREYILRLVSTTVVAYAIITNDQYEDHYLHHA